MNNISFETNIPLEKWDRLDSEINLLKNVFINKNIRSTEIWYDIIQKYAPCTEDMIIEAEKYFSEGLKYFLDGNFSEALKMYSTCIYRAPDNSEILIKSLTHRAEIYFKMEKYDEAICDYEVLFEFPVHLSTSLKYLWHSVQCFILNNDIDGAIKQLKASRSRYKDWLKYYNKIGSIYQNNMKAGTPNSFTEQYFKLAEKFYSCDVTKLFAEQEESINKCNISLKPKFIDVVKDIPYMGYTTNSLINRASIACSLINSNDKNQKILANRNIPLSSILLIDQPYVFSQAIDNILCNVCHKSCDIYCIPCFKCHIKTYCSSTCKNIDNTYHKYECEGYKILLFPILNIDVEFRLLIRGLNYMRKHIFTLEKIKSVQCADDLFKILMDVDIINQQHSDYNIVLTLPTKYEQLTYNHYEHCISNALRLSIYIRKFTTIRQDFFSNTKLPSNEIDLFLAGLIMRHSAQKICHICKISYDNINMNNYNNNINETQCDIKKENDPDINKFYLNHFKGNKIDVLHLFSEMNNVKLFLSGINLHLEKIKESLYNFSKQFTIKQRQTNYYNSSHDNNNNNNSINNNDNIDTENITINEYNTIIDNINMYISNYIDFINNNNMFDRNINENFNDIQRIMIKLYNLLPGIIPPNNNNTIIHNIDLLYPTFSMIKHSCDPNAYYVILESKHVIVRALRNINFGEEITISRGLDYRSHTKNFRKMYLEKIYINCLCHLCLSNYDYCDKFYSYICNQCNSLIKTETSCCYKCNYKCTNTRLYAELIKIIDYYEDIVLETAHECKKFSMNLVNLSLLFAFCSSKSLVIYRKQLKLISFFVNNGFPGPALQIMKEIIEIPRNSTPPMSRELFKEYIILLRPFIDILKKAFEDKEYLKKNSDAMFKIHQFVDTICREMLNIVELNIIAENCTLLLIDTLNFLKQSKNKIYLIYMLNNKEDEKKNLDKIYSSKKIIHFILNKPYDDETILSKEEIENMAVELINIAKDVNFTIINDLKYNESPKEIIENDNKSDTIDYSAPIDFVQEKENKRAEETNIQSLESVEQIGELIYKCIDKINLKKKLDKDNNTNEIDTNMTNGGVKGKFMNEKLNDIDEEETIHQQNDLLKELDISDSDTSSFENQNDNKININTNEFVETTIIDYNNINTDLDNNIELDNENNNSNIATNNNINNNNNNTNNNETGNKKIIKFKEKTIKINKSKYKKVKKIKFLKNNYNIKEPYIANKINPMNIDDINIIQQNTGVDDINHTNESISNIVTETTLMSSSTVVKAADIISANSIQTVDTEEKQPNEEIVEKVNDDVEKEVEFVSEENLLKEVNKEIIVEDVVTSNADVDLINTSVEYTPKNVIDNFNEYDNDDDDDLLRDWYEIVLEEERDMKLSNTSKISPINCPVIIQQPFKDIKKANNFRHNNNNNSNNHNNNNNKAKTFIKSKDDSVNESTTPQKQYNSNHNNNNYSININRSNKNYRNDNNKNDNHNSNNNIDSVRNLNRDILLDDNNKTNLIDKQLKHNYHQDIYKDGGNKYNKNKNNNNNNNSNSNNNNMKQFNNKNKRYNNNNNNNNNNSNKNQNSNKNNNNNNSRKNQNRNDDRQQKNDKIIYSNNNNNNRNRLQYNNKDSDNFNRNYSDNSQRCYNNNNNDNYDNNNKYNNNNKSDQEMNKMNVTTTATTGSTVNNNRMHNTRQQHSNKNNNNNNNNVDAWDKSNNNNNNTSYYDVVLHSKKEID